MDGKKGPIYLDLPGDVLATPVETEKLHYPTNYRVDARPAGDPALIERAIEILQQAQRPIVVTGSGVLWSEASEEMRRFIDATGIPFWTTPQGRGVVPEDHPRSFTAARSTAFREADVVLVIGARANSMLTFLLPPRFSAEAKFINVNIDGKEIGHNRGVDLGIIGDAKLVLRQLTAAAAGRFRPREETPWISRLSAKQRSNQERDTPLLHSDKVPIHPLRLCNEVRDIITRDTNMGFAGY